MALVDQRFEPDVIEVAVRRAVAAWAEAIDGEDDALLAISDPAVVNELLYHGDSTGRTRVVVRGPALKELHVLGLDTRATPPRVAVSAEVEGARYIEDRDTTSGAPGRPEAPADLHPAARPGARRRCARTRGASWRRSGCPGRRFRSGGERGGTMDDQSVSDHIEALVAEEHRLLENDPGTPEHRERLAGRAGGAGPLLGSAAPAAQPRGVRPRPRPEHRPARRGHRRGLRELAR